MTLPAASEQDLLHRARLGDDDAFAQLVYAFTPRLYRLVRRMTDDAAEAESIVQEAFLRAWQALPRYQNDRPFFPYLVTIATNLARDLWRKTRRLDFTGVEDENDTWAGEETSPERQLEETEALQQLAAAVAALPPPYRAVIALRYDVGLAYEQIAAALDLPVNTVRTHLRRAKARLRLALQENNPDVF